MTIDIGAFEEMERAILSAGVERVAEIKRDLQQKLKDVGMGCAPHPDSPEGAMQHLNLYMDALCDMRLGACRWNAIPLGDSRMVALTATELDFFADWYDVTSALARSINQRQKDGRGGCNAAKKDEFLRFVGDHEADIRKLISMGRRYASYLNERSQQIVRMCNMGSYCALDKIDAFCSKYL